MPVPSSSKTGTGRPRGRRAGANVPCSECIARASRKQEEGAAIELCSKCTAALHRPRRKSDQTNVKRTRRQSWTTIAPSPPGLPSDLASVKWSGDQQEEQGLQFFIMHSAPQFAGYFNSPFWQRMVLQTGQHEPAVRHAIAAIGALHETLVTRAADPLRSSEDGRTRYALEQCNVSIQHLVKPARPTSKPDLQLMLTTCVLYTYFEALQYHYEQAMMHARQGYSLLQQYAMDPKNRRWDIGAFAVELDQLCLLIRRRQQTLSRSSSLDRNFKVLPDSESIKSTLPLDFRSLEQARSTLQMALNNLLIMFLDMELDDAFYQLAMSDLQRPLFYAPWLLKWEQAFTNFLSNHWDSLGEEDRKIAKTLKAHHLTAEILAGVDLSHNELGWDAFGDKFSTIVTLAAAVLKDGTVSEGQPVESRWSNDESSEETASAGLSLSLGIVDPLYEVCARCRDPALRNRAADLLANHPRQDYVWSSCNVWKVGEILMRCEEQEREIRAYNESSHHKDQQTSQPLITSISQSSMGQAATPELSHTEPIKRMAPRYALNPGLFEDWQTVGEGCTEDMGHRLTGQEDKLPFSQALLTPESNVAFAPALRDGYGSPEWIDYDAFQHVIGIPTIFETPPDD